MSVKNVSSIHQNIVFSKAALCAMEKPNNLHRKHAFKEIVINIKVKIIDGFTNSCLVSTTPSKQFDRLFLIIEFSQVQT